jgi:hypothetical protein
MKPKIISTVFAIVLLVILGFGIKKSKTNRVNLSDLALNNIEALADSEIIVGPFCMHIYPMPVCVYYPDEGIILYGVPYNG